MSNRIMSDTSKLLTILSDSEKAAFYDRPEFNNKQRLEFLILTGEELQMAFQRKTVSNQVYCILQVGYFKAVKMFFRVGWEQIAKDDINFILAQYFQKHKFMQQPISKREHYTSCVLITQHFSYCTWSSNSQAQLQNQAMISTQRDNNSQVVALALLSYLQDQKIILRKALFEFDKLIRSIHTLKYLLDSSIQKNTHRSQNRVESYHQLRGAIAQVYGKKQLIGKTDIALEISNQCGRLIANAIIHYNSMILSKLRDKYEAANDQNTLTALKKISPVVWQHINFIGRLNFSDERNIDLDEMVTHLMAAA